MAKGSGDTRVSKWRGARAPITEDLYYEGGQRLNYFELPADKKKVIREEKDRIIDEMVKSLAGKKTVKMMISEKDYLEVQFTKPGITHFCNDAMVKLSGKYFSERSMKNIPDILEKAEFLPPAVTTRPGEHKGDGRVKWFYYKDKTGREVYFGVAFNKGIRAYEFYTVTETNPHDKKE